MSESTDSTRPLRRVAVIGGGITGLAAAHRLTELAPQLEVRLFESRNRLGGVIRTERQDDFLLEHGPDMLTTKEPWAMDLCRRIGMGDEMIRTNGSHRRAFVVHQGRLEPVPPGFSLMSSARVWPMVTTPILSPWGKLRLGWEYFVPARRGDQDESLAEFSIRRLGREVYERLVQPLVGGIYTADPHRLSMQAAMPQFVAMEKTFGSMARGIRHAAKQARAGRQQSGARYDMFVAPRQGMDQLVQALAARLPAGCVRLNQAIVKLTPSSQGWEVTPAGAGREWFDGVVLAAPAQVVSGLVRDTQQELSQELAQIPYASAAVLIAAYRRDQISHPLDGFGVVMPIREQRKVLAVSFASVKFPARAPRDFVLLRAFIGGACQAELLSLDDARLGDLVDGELQELLGLRGAPTLVRVARWMESMPQYHVGHLERIGRIERLAAGLPRLVLAGNAYRGVGIPCCVRSGEHAVERLLGYGEGHSKKTPLSSP